MSPLKPFFPLTYHFFGLTYDYKAPFLREVYFCVRHLKFNYKDIMEMPTYERRFYINLFKDEMDQVNEQRSNNSSGSKRISGEQLKNSIKKGQIPSQ